MNEFQSLSQRQDMRELKGRPSMGRKQAKRRTDPLAARCHQMRAHFCHQVIFRRNCFQKTFFQDLQVTFYHIKHVV